MTPALPADGQEPGKTNAGKSATASVLELPLSSLDLTGAAALCRPAGLAGTAEGTRRPPAQARARSSGLPVIWAEAVCTFLGPRDTPSPKLGVSETELPTSHWEPASRSDSTSDGGTSVLLDLMPETGTSLDPCTPPLPTHKPAPSPGGPAFQVSPDSVHTYCHHPGPAASRQPALSPADHCRGPPKTSWSQLVPHAAVPECGP